MKFEVSADVKAPVDRVWDAVTDFAAHEAALRDREADLWRVGDWQAARAGAAWRGTVVLRGKTRVIAAGIAEFSPDTRLVVDGRIDGVAARYAVDVQPLTAEVTRLTAVLELAATTLSARLLLQGMKLGRQPLLERMERALRREADAVERAWRAGRGPRERGRRASGSGGGLPG